MALSHRLIVVDRNHEAIVGAVLQEPDRWPPKSGIMLDRRAGQRRVSGQAVSTDRRQCERRMPLDPMWPGHGFTVVYVHELPPEAIVLDELPPRSDRAA